MLEDFHANVLNTCSIVLFLWFIGENSNGSFKSVKHMFFVHFVIKVGSLPCTCTSFYLVNNAHALQTRY